MNGHKLTKKHQEEGVIIAQAVRKRYPRKRVRFRGYEFRLYSIAWLANLSGKSAKTIAMWERDNNFPTPIFDLKDGYRWYTSAELHGYRRLIAASNLRRGRYRGGGSPMRFFQQNAFKFKMRLQEYLKDNIGDFPKELADEEAIIGQIAKARKIAFTQPELLALINS